MSMCQGFKICPVNLLHDCTGDKSSADLFGRFAQNKAYFVKEKEKHGIMTIIIFKSDNVSLS